MSRRGTIASAIALVAFTLPAIPAAAQVDDYHKIKYPKLPDFQIPRPETLELDNGLKVFLLEDHELPLIQVYAQIRTGSNYDPADKVGLADIFGQVQREGGTRSMTGDAMDDFLEARAASLETNMGGDAGFASMDCLKEDFDAVFKLFYEVLRYPAFAEDKIELAKVQTSTGIARRNDSISGITSREFPRLVYGPDSPLSRLTEYATLAAIGRQDLLAWHARYYHPNSIYLGVVGDFDAAEMRRKIQAQFGDWPRGEALKLPDVAYAKPVKPGIYAIEKSDVTQAYVRLGHLGIETRNPDYFAAQVMNEVLGGSFASRLFSTVRSEKGLAYSVFGGIGSSFLREGIFQVGLSTKSSTMAEAVEALETEVHGIIDNPPNPEEMRRAKDSILNSFVFNYDSPGEVLNQQMTYAYYGLPADFLEQYRVRIEKVTGEEVAEVARKYIHPDRMVLLVVGKSEEFDRPVSSFGKVTTLDITIPEPPSTEPEVQRTAETLRRGSELMAKVAAAIGGGRGKVESIERETSVALSMGGQKMSAKVDTVYELPDKMRQRLQLPMGEQMTVVNGERGVASFAGQSQPIPLEMIAEARADMHRELLFLVGSVGEASLEAVASGSDTVDGRECQVVAVRFEGTESRLCVAADGRVLKQTYQGKHPMTRAPGSVEVRFSDYREVDGRMLPHKIDRSDNGEKTIEVEVDAVRINGQVDETLFELPAA